ncbi:MAG: APC family permease [Terriglobia bacterium]
MSLVDILFGRPLRSSEDRGEKLGGATGVPIFGLDALSSAAYGPEAALTLLIPLGAAGIFYIIPVSICIIVLLSIVYFSYRQTIEAYPTGGGSYTVARENLGPSAGLLAAAALMIDYTLTAAVGISAGVGALVSAVPALQPRTLSICLLILLAITLVNLRGLREASLAFMVPTYIFIGTLLTTLGLGVIKALLAGGHPKPVVAPPTMHAATEALGAFLLLKAFSSGCTAMTGVEAVSNGVQAFQEPVVKTAQKTLTTIIALLIVFLAGIAYLAYAYHIGATEPGQPGYQSVLSMLIGAVAGRNAFYYITIASILAVLSLSANTAFADFPRLCRMVAQDGYLPIPLATRGRRLVYTQGILALAILSAVLLIVFDGVTDRLIPLYAIGAFMAFTLSQSGMVMHWRRGKDRTSRKARRSMLINGVGAVATATTVVVVTLAKFTEGAWITVVLIPAIIILMVMIHRHYRRVEAEIAAPKPLDLAGLRSPLIVVPVTGWNKAVESAMRFALTLSREVVVVHVAVDEETDELYRNWRRLVEEPARESNLPPPRLVTLPSPYRFIINPIVDYILQLEQENQARQIALLLPELVEQHWYHYFLHNQRGKLLKALLLLKGNRGTVIISVPWYLQD